MKIIEIDLVNASDLYEKYNKKNISKELLNYIVACSFGTKDTIKLIINNKCGIEASQLIKEGLKKEYVKVHLTQRKNNIIQISYLLIGVLILFISTLINKEILKEIVLIGGWVFIWAMVELELFSDVNERKKRKVLKKLLNSEILENNML